MSDGELEYVRLLELAVLGVVALGRVKDERLEHGEALVDARAPPLLHQRLVGSARLRCASRRLLLTAIYAGGRADARATLAGRLRRHSNAFWAACPESLRHVPLARARFHARRMPPETLRPTRISATE